MRNVLIFSLSALVVLGSAKVMVQKMLCLNSGNSSYSFDFDSCCHADDHEGESISETCCDFNAVTFEFTDLKNPVEYKLKTIPIIQNSVYCDLNVLSFDTGSEPEEYQLPPPKPLLTRLSLHQTYLC